MCGLPAEAHLCVVAGGDGVRPLIQGPVQQGAEFDLPVAVYAGVRRAAVGVRPHKPVHHLTAELLAQIQHHVGNPKCPGHRFCRVDVICGTAQARTVLECVEPHGHAGDLIASLEQQERRSRAVHSAAHGSKNPFRHRSSPFPCRAGTRPSAAQNPLI